MELVSAIQHAANGEAIAFLGAGFSLGATNVTGSPLKSAHELAAHLATIVGLPSDSRLEDASEEFLAQQGEDRLIAELKNQFTARETTSAQQEIARIPWKRVYTTNYDNAFELAATSVSRAFLPITLSDALQDVPKDQPICIHLNGYVDRLTRETIASEIKLTDTSYLTSAVAASPWAAFFRHDISIARAVFFIGYSLADIDINRLLFEDSTLREKTHFIVGHTPSHTTERRANRLGHVSAITSSELAQEISEALAGFTPKLRTPPIFYCLSAYNPPANPLKPSDTDVFDLVMRGTINPQFVASSLQGSSQYLLERPAADRVLRLFAGGSQAVVLHSDLGNGKSALLEVLKYRAAEAGFDVLSLDRRSFDVLAELEEIASPEQKTLLMIENYPDWLDEMAFIVSRRNDNLFMVLTARTSPHDVLVDRLETILTAQEVPEVSVDSLTQPDISWLVDFLDLYGLWGKHAAASRVRKLAILSNDCRSQFHAILLLTLEAPQILSRFESLLTSLNERRDFYQVLIAILVLTVLIHNPSLDLLVDLFGDQVLSIHFRRDPSVRELVDMTASSIRLRSSVAAQFILKRVANPRLTVEVLEHMARAADRGAPVSKLHRDLSNRLMRFSSIQHVLPEEGKQSAVYAYYETIKSLGRARRNPYFWLQYAIACTVFEDFERAATYFDTAYSLASKLEWFDAFQIDNHYARFLLLRSTREGNPDGAMTSLRRARDIVNRQLTERERFHYPFRIATSYANFYDAFETSLTEKEAQEVARAAAFVGGRIPALSVHLRGHPDIIRCAEAMEYLRLRIEERQSPNA